MVETAAHLAVHVFPRLPLREWVLAAPIAAGMPPMCARFRGFLRPLPADHHVSNGSMTAE